MICYLSVKTLINITFVLKNLTYSNQLANTESQEFKSLAVPFCGYVRPTFTFSNKLIKTCNNCRIVSPSDLYAICNTTFFCFSVN